MIRILGLGDSFTLGYEVDVEDTYLYQLEEKLNEGGTTNFEVINLAVSGFGTAEELITLMYEGFKYSPDLVLLGYFGNDIKNNITSNLFSLKNDTLQRESLTYLPAVAIRKRFYSIPGYRYLAENSQLLNILRNEISYRIHEGLYHRIRNIKAAGLEVGSKMMRVGADSAIALYEETLTARLLDEIYKECEQRSIPSLVLNIPVTMSTSKEVSSNIPIHLMHFADNIIFIDAKNIIAPYHGKVEINWEKWHGHWRPWVHHLVPAVLADTVMKYFQDFDHPSGDSLVRTQQGYGAKTRKAVTPKLLRSN